MAPAAHGEPLKRGFSEAVKKRSELEGFTVNEIQDSQHKQELLREADEAMAVVRLVGDYVTGAAIFTADGEAKKRGGKVPDRTRPVVA